MRKFLYFRSVTDEANDGVTGLKTNAPSSFLFPADSLVAMQPTGDTTLTLYFKPALLTGHSAESVRDTVDLTVTQGDTYEVMDAITSAVNEGPHSDGFVTIADNLTTTDSATAALANLNFFWPIEVSEYLPFLYSIFPEPLILFTIAVIAVVLVTLSIYFKNTFP